jgi:hypothetical protein
MSEQIKESLPADNPAIRDFLSGDDAEICPRCGNIYRVVWMNAGDDYNDFGQRYCPFCGS